MAAIKFQFSLKDIKGLEPGAKLLLKKPLFPGLGDDTIPVLRFDHASEDGSKFYFDMLVFEDVFLASFEVTNKNNRLEWEEVA